MKAAVQATAVAPDVQSSKLLATLGVSSALAGALIVVAYLATLPAIEANRAARLDSAIRQVLKDAARYETLYLVNGTLTANAPTGADAAAAQPVYAGVTASGAPAGMAIRAATPGFADTIEVLFGYDPHTHALLGLVVLSSKETPGLGDKILADSWLAQFAKVLAPLRGVKAGAATTRNDVQMITGATISSRAVINGINKSLEQWMPILDAYVAGGVK